MGRYFLPNSVRACYVMAHRRGREMGGSGEINVTLTHPPTHKHKTHTDTQMQRESEREIPTHTHTHTDSHEETHRSCYRFSILCVYTKILLSPVSLVAEL